jgi:glycosyltransferase involved in cell wall biosynthesis
VRILIYTHAFAPKVGGAETYVMHLARGLADGHGREACEVIVATPTPAGGFGDSSLPFRVVREPSLNALWRLVSWADVVQLAGPVFVPLFLALLRGRPVVIEHHGYQAVCPNGLLFLEPEKRVCPGHFMMRRYHRCVRCVAAAEGLPRALLKVLLTFPRRWLCRGAAAHVAITAHVARRIALPRTEVIYYGVPMSTPSASEPRPRDLPLTFAYVGRLVSEKGLPVLLEAARALRDQGCLFRLRVIGDGPERSRLEQRSAALGLRELVEFTGFLRGAALEDALRDVQAVVMPSIWEETAGLAAIEHMMRGRLVIASAIGGLAEVVGEAGFLFETGDPRGLAACMRRVLDDPSVAWAVGMQARQRAEQLFRVDRMVEDHDNLYRRVRADRR